MCVRVCVRACVCVRAACVCISGRYSRPGPARSACRRTDRGPDAHAAACVGPPTSASRGAGACPHSRAAPGPRMPLRGGRGGGTRAGAVGLQQRVPVRLVSHPLPQAWPATPPPPSPHTLSGPHLIPHPARPYPSSPLLTLPVCSPRQSRPSARSPPVNRPSPLTCFQAVRPPGTRALCRSERRSPAQPCASRPAGPQAARRRRRRAPRTVGLPSARHGRSARAGAARDAGPTGAVTGAGPAGTRAAGCGSTRRRWPSAAAAGEQPSRPCHIPVTSLSRPLSWCRPCPGFWVIGSAGGPWRLAAGMPGSLTGCGDLRDR